MLFRFAVCLPNATFRLEFNPLAAERQDTVAAESLIVLLPNRMICLRSKQGHHHGWSGGV